MLRTNEDNHDGIYRSDSYFFSHKDALINLDYICIAMFMKQRLNFLGADYLDCLKLAINSSTKQENASLDIIEQACRVQKILYER